MNGSGLRALVSIHDVMPDTLPQVEAILGRLASLRIAPVTLLVVPGSPWTRQELLQVRSWQDAGIVLAGHGWRHRCGPPETLRHRLHSRLISRRVAEHLALPPRLIVELMRQCGGWFVENGFSAPDLYVPPAWAMGPVRRPALSGLSFRFFETLSGLFDAGKNRFIPLPVAGYEADTRLRALLLKAINAAGIRWARRFDRPLRIAIHPCDFDHRLSADLCALLSGPLRPIGYHDAGQKDRR